MLAHYFILASRVIIKNKVHFFISILGLAVGMGVCLLIYQYIQFEMSFDTFHTNSQNIYRITQKEIRNGEHAGTSVFTPHALGAGGKEEIPEID